MIRFDDRGCPGNALFRFISKSLFMRQNETRNEKRNEETILVGGFYRFSFLSSTNKERVAVVGVGECTHVEA